MYGYAAGILGVTLLLFWSRQWRRRAGSAPAGGAGAGGSVKER